MEAHFENFRRRTVYPDTEDSKRGDKMLLPSVDRYALNSNVYRKYQKKEENES